MYRIARGSEVSQTIQHSRFIGYALACTGERELRTLLGGIAGQHPNAHHLAFAYRIKTPAGWISHFNDAGEPGGTAGKPILSHVEGFDVANVVVAVVRYFGGIKLGAGGLVRAYGGTARMALEAAELAPYVEFATFRVHIDYADLQSLTYQLGKAGGEILAKEFGAQVELTIRLPVDEAEAFRHRYGGA